jgi:hypothetical protein
MSPVDEIILLQIVPDIGEGRDDSTTASSFQAIVIAAYHLHPG